MDKDMKTKKLIVRLTPEAASRLDDWERQLDRSRTWIVSSLLLNPTGAMGDFAQRVKDRKAAIKRKIEQLKQELE
jgi:predicted transcriptional regulator